MHAYANTCTCATTKHMRTRTQARMQARTRARVHSRKHAHTHHPRAASCAVMHTRAVMHACAVMRPCAVTRPCAVMHACAVMWPSAATGHRAVMHPATRAVAHTCAQGRMRPCTRYTHTCTQEHAMHAAMRACGHTAMQPHSLAATQPHNAATQFHCYVRSHAPHRAVLHRTTQDHAAGAALEGIPTRMIATPRPLLVRQKWSTSIKER